MAAVLLYVCSSYVVWQCWLLPPVQADSLRCPSSCTCLGNNVDCSNFGLINIPKDIPAWATRLELQSNSITEVRPGDLDGLYGLQYLDLSNNNLNIINGTVLKDLVNLQTLKLDSNKLTEIPLFPAPVNITELTLTRNHVVTIPIVAMQRMPELLIMDLSNNYILSIINGTFPAGSKLTHLNLNSNQISVIEQGSMSNLTFLESFKANRNKLTELPQSIFNHLNSLKTIDLMRNKIKMIKGLTFQGLSKLQVLKLQRNSIINLKDGAFWGLPSLNSLQMDNNKIVNITQGWLFGLKMLKSLTLSHNKINRIEPAAWEPCKHLAKLDLTNNKLTAITETTLAQLTTLDTLLLDHNQITRIDEGAFRDQEDLSTLEINANEISWAMEDMSGAFRGLTGLTKLGLRANAIRSIAVHAFAGLPRLRQLHLEDNDITLIQENAFETLRNLRDLRFNSSKLFCDCHLAWLPPWLKQSGFQHSSVGTCFHPPVLRGAALLQVDVADFKCNNAEFPKPVILESPKSANGYKGENMTLACITAISGESQPKIYWKKDNMVLNESLSVVTASSDGDVKRYTSSLHLTDIQDSMVGRYQCVVSNDFGSAFSQRAYVNVYVFPVFLKVPKNVTVKAGKPVELKCAATGQPTPVISWQKDGGDNFPAARERRMQVYPHDDRFYIMNTRTADEGVYSCMARNEAGVVITNATVTVLVPPFIEQPMQSKKISKKGETTVLQCMASGSPQPKLTWMKDDKELVVTPRHFFTVDSQILVIVETQWSDAGTYACRMSNSLGTAKGTTELQVVNSSGEASESGGSFGLDNESTTTGIIIIAVVCCVVGTSLVWVIIIYQTRKRHEVYSATPTDETTLPGEVPSSGYMSSDKEGSYSQGPATTNGYHYQDYQMKESGYESSSGQLRVNGYTRPPICPNAVDEDDNQPPTLTAGDRLLRQINAAKSTTGQPYPASDGDTIGSRHSTSSGHHSGSSDPPSSHSDQQGHIPAHQQLHVVTSEETDFRRNPSSHHPAVYNKLDEFLVHCSNQQLISPGFQTFHPKKPTNHDRSNVMNGGYVKCDSASIGCEHSDGHGRPHGDFCDNRDVEYASSAATSLQPHCSACLSKYSVMTDSNPIIGRLHAHPEIQQTNNNNNHPRFLHGMADGNGNGHSRLPNVNFCDSSGCSHRQFCSDSKPSHIPTSSSHLSLSSSSSPLIHLPNDSKCKPQNYTRGCGNNKLIQSRGDYVDSSMCLDSPKCECCAEMAGGGLCRTVPVQTVSSRGGMLCCCDQHHCFKHQSEQGSACSQYTCQQHSNCHTAAHHKQQQHLTQQQGKTDAMARSRSSGSMCQEPRYCSHSDPVLSPGHADCVENELLGQSRSHLCHHLPCTNHQRLHTGENPPPSSVRNHFHGKLPHIKPQAD